ncbi:MAG: FG-GAP-like repeat-containing protein [Paludisphaera borealis]|uniref:FG-GAP-like repeat-containing protein n=1 Tax=Paludisphaera borealis TaxID=1387353 RepID=UPI00283EF489|nr:FG-GAP-like repeat-containing protein [Paludisphaera borealis]MDR3619600.1 FG-GAP-like repeat-containing protein [Paludisphaera borealis]
MNRLAMRLALGLLVVALIAAAWRLDRSRRIDGALQVARAEIERGQFESALRSLSPWRDRADGHPEIGYWAGVCEQALNRPEAAAAAWERVAAGSPWRGRAILGRARILVESMGRYAQAEALLTDALQGPAEQALEARGMLVPLLRWQNRSGDVRRLVENGWARGAVKPDDLLLLWRLDDEPMPVDQIRARLDEAARLAPDDDRVMLGRARFLLATGEVAEAGALLDRCLEQRPDDPAVQEARLDWAMTAKRPDEAARALRKLPADRLSIGLISTIDAWAAALAGDADAERRALEGRLDADPGDATALDRLASLAMGAGRDASAAEYRRRKDVIDQARRRYLVLLQFELRSAEHEELAHLAETLGRWPEAWGWWTLAAREHRGDSRLVEAIEKVRSRPSPLPSSTALAATSDRLDRLTAVSGRAAGPAVVGAFAFRDAAESSGLKFVFASGRSPQFQLPETMAGGAGLIDYDGDGWLDVYAVQGGPVPAPADARNGDRLFRNLGEGRFEDVTRAAGLADLAGGYGHGVAVGDFDGDGRPDLFITRLDAYALYRNKGDGTFEDVTDRLGLGGPKGWPTSAAWADLDGDGDLDLYVCHYLDWDAHNPKPCSNNATSSPTGYCDPRLFPGQQDRLYRNDGSRFVDVTAEAGIVDADGRGLGVLAADLDEDGRIDLFVANDTTANYLYHNLGGMRFEENGLVSGVACNANGGFQAGMGVTTGDLDGDGRLDLAVTNFYNESTTFFRALGRGLFEDQSKAVGLAAPTRYSLGFGIAFADFDSDGRLDLAIANGHVNDSRPKVSYAMPAQLFAGVEGGRLVEVGRDAGLPWRTSRVGRGLCVGDLDNDGRLDLIVVSLDGSLAYFHNESPPRRFVTLKLEGAPSNRDAVGARVAVINADGRRRIAHRVGGGSYLSASDSRLHFGLGDDDRPVDVEITWPSGRKTNLKQIQIDRGYHVREGDAPHALRPFVRSH